MKRKITSLLLALVMTLALAIPAFASSANYYFDMSDTAATLTDGTASLTFAATTRVPKISLYMPSVGANPVVFNPYKIKYDATVVETDTLNGENGVVDPTDQTKQIISPVYAIGNMSDTQLTVGVSATTTVEGNLALANTVAAATETGNKAAITLKFVTTKTPTTTAPATVTLPANNAQQDITDVGLVALADRRNSESLVLTSGTKAAEIKVADNKLILPQTPGGTDSFDASKGNYLLFQFVGEAAQKPTKAWTASDKFTTVLAFTFQPSAKADLSLAPTGAWGTTAKGDVATAPITPANDLPGAASTPNAQFTAATGGPAATLESDSTFKVAESVMEGLNLSNGDIVTATGTIAYDKADGTKGSVSVEIIIPVDNH